MKSFKRITGLVAPLDRSNVDTDAIIPKQFLKSIRRTGFGQNLFDEWRYLDHGESGQDCTHRPLNPDFVLNEARYRGAQILLARDNFGCGSSREHAPWALEEYGFRAIIAPGFAEIFFSNCLKNGLLPIALEAGVVDELFRLVLESTGYQLLVDLPEQLVRTPEGREYRFALDAFRKNCLLEGLDEIGLTLQRAEKIRQYEQRRMQIEPWVFSAL